MKIICNLTCYLVRSFQASFARFVSTLTAKCNGTWAKKKSQQVFALGLNLSLISKLSKKDEDPKQRP
jgi:hypothetical protein